jgi:hypothetical protein
MGKIVIHSSNESFNVVSKSLEIYPSRESINSLKSIYVSLIHIKEMKKTRKGVKMNILLLTLKIGNIQWDEGKKGGKTTEE